MLMAPFYVCKIVEIQTSKFSNKFYVGIVFKFGFIILNLKNLFVSSNLFVLSNL